MLQALEWARRQAGSTVPFFVFLLGPSYPDEDDFRPVATDGAEQVGRYKRAEMLRVLSEEYGPCILGGEMLTDVGAQSADGSAPRLGAFEHEAALMLASSAIVVIPVSPGACIELGQIADRHDAVCTRTLIIDFEETKGTYTEEAIRTAITHGATVVPLTCDEALKCEALEHARRFVRHMHRRYVSRRALSGQLP